MERAPSPSAPHAGGRTQGRGALEVAQEVSARAAELGFDWPSVALVREKVDEELRELDDVMGGVDVDRVRVEEELGDLLFTVVNLARHLGLSAEAALAGATDKFTRRFRSVQAQLAASGTPVQEAGLAELDACWRLAKSMEEG